MKLPGKWVEGLASDTPVREAARRVLKLRVDGAETLLDEAARKGKKDAKAVHQARVGTRRAEAALALFAPWLDAERVAPVAKALRKIRRAAGRVRDCDVHAEIFRTMREHAPLGRGAGAAHAGSASGAGQEVVIDFLLERMEQERARAFQKLKGLRKRYGGGRLERLRRMVTKEMGATGADGPERPATDPGVGAEATLVDAARRTLPPALDEAKAAAAKDLANLDQLHALRVLTKGLRYSVELVAPVLGERVVGDLFPRLVELQERLGEVNDSATVVARLEDQIAAIAAEEEKKASVANAVPVPGAASQALVAGLGVLLERYRVLRDRRVQRFVQWWAEHDGGALLGALEAAVLAAGPRPAAATPNHAEGRTGRAPGGPSGNGRHANGSARQPGPANVSAATAGGQRLAAIDVGTNSIRLVIAEAHPDGTYRMLDDERELARLGQGLVHTERLSPEAMERAVAAIGRMRAIAAGYGCAPTLVRAVATAAVREAVNGPEFVAMVRARTGVELRVIDAEEEARLAFLSVSRAFGDVRALSAGVVDIGGGSMEVVLSSRGVVEQVCTLPLGAVRVTERFGGAQQCAGKRYDRMRDWIKETIDERIGEPPLSPEILIGTGGTVTTLAAIAMQRERDGRGSEDGAPAPATVQGYQLRRDQIKEILDDLRSMNLEERMSVPGLNPDRADIIVAGVAVVEALMKHLGVQRLRVHDRGIRDGLLLTMIRELYPAAESKGGASGRGAGERLGAARRFAQMCRYEERHSEHVAHLALQIFDALAPVMPRADDLWSEPLARELLEAGAVLHDVGYIINYAEHHKHSYHLIVHADLPGFSRREVEVVANLGRYHRRSEPKDKHPEFAALAPEDRDLVRRLAAILRIADGLDRTHTQNVRSVWVRGEGGTAVFVLESEDDPATDAWGASRKAGLFQDVFGLEARFEWAGAKDAAPMIARMSTA
jgi:exopolyphosphatase/guanosine-5'-triphosphate,3'-diphosphate pyrophosphatase